MGKSCGAVRPEADRFSYPFKELSRTAQVKTATMTSSFRPQTAVLPVLLLLLAALSGCAVYDTRHPTTGGSYVDGRVQDQQLAEDRQMRIARAKEWDDEERRQRRVRFQKYFD
jgi:hypothetical protein